MTQDKAQEFLSKAWGISNDRYGKYGEPSPLFTAVARTWNAYLDFDHNGLDGADVAMMMVMFKVIRHQFSSSDDDLIDVVGYTVNAADMEASIEDAKEE